MQACSPQCHKSASHPCKEHKMAVISNKLTLSSFLSFLFQKNWIRMTERQVSNMCFFVLRTSQHYADKLCKRTIILPLLWIKFVQQLTEKDIDKQILNNYYFIFSSWTKLNEMGFWIWHSGLLSDSHFKKMKSWGCFTKEMTLTQYI